MVGVSSPEVYLRGRPAGFASTLQELSVSLKDTIGHHLHLLQARRAHQQLPSLLSLHGRSKQRVAVGFRVREGRERQIEEMPSPNRQRRVGNCEQATVHPEYNSPCISTYLIESKVAHCRSNEASASDLKSPLQLTTNMAHRRGDILK